MSWSPTKTTRGSSSRARSRTKLAPDSASLWFALQRRRTPLVRRRLCRCGLGRQRVCLQRVEVHDRERPGMGGVQDDGRRHARVQRLLPAKHAESPPIARLQAGKAIGRDRRREVVAPAPGEAQERLRHLRADDVRAPVLRPRAAVARAEEPGQRVHATRLKRRAEHIPGRVHIEGRGVVVVGAIRHGTGRAYGEGKPFDASSPVAFAAPLAEASNGLAASLQRASASLRSVAWPGNLKLFFDY